MLSLREQSTPDTTHNQSGYQLLEVAENRLNTAAGNGTADGFRLERSLKAIFGGLLAVVVCALTFQNLSNGFAILQDPFDRFEVATQRLISHCKVETAEALATLSQDLSSTPGFETAILMNNMDEAARLAAHAFVHFNGDTGRFNLTVYSADQSVLYRSFAPLVQQGASSPGSETDVATSLAGAAPGLEYTAEGNLAVGSLRPLVFDGQLRGYLKLTTDIEPALTLMSTTVDGTILKAGGPLRPVHAGVAAGADLSSGPVPFPGQRPLPPSAVQDILEGRAAASWLSPLLFVDSRVLIAQPLALDIVNGVTGSQVFFVRDISPSAYAFIRTLVVSIFVCAGVALLAMFGLRRLLNRLQQTIRQTQNSLEAEVSSNTKALERSRSQLLEAQAIASIGSWEGNLEAQEIRGSKEFFRILGIPQNTSPNEILTRFFSQIPEPELPKVRALVKTAIKSCNSFDFEHSI